MFICNDKLLLLDRTLNVQLRSLLPLISIINIQCLIFFCYIFPKCCLIKKVKLANLLVAYNRNLRKHKQSQNHSETESLCGRRGANLLRVQWWWPHFLTPDASEANTQLLRYFPSLMRRLVGKNKLEGSVCVCVFVRVCASAYIHTCGVVQE